MNKCDVCGYTGFMDFHVPDELWNSVVGSSGGVWCFNCFDKQVQKMGGIKLNHQFITVWIVNDDHQFQNGFKQGYWVAKEEFGKLACDSVNEMVKDK